MLTFTAMLFSVLLIHVVIALPKPRISHGTNAKKGQWPSQVMIKTGEAFGRICGGSIISAEWVLTAAHCVRQNESGVIYDPLKYEVVFGEYDRSQYDGTEVSRNIAEIIRHPQYESTNHSFDIALIRIKNPLNFNSEEEKHLRPICLNTMGKVTYEECYLTGFGRLGSYDSPPYILQQIRMKPFNHEACVKLYEEDNANNPWIESHEQVTNLQICMVSYESSTNSKPSHGGACAGDSGGPLQCKYGENWHQVGVTWSTVNCDTDPTVFQEVVKYKEFIQSKTGYTLPSYCTK